MTVAVDLAGSDESDGEYGLMDLHINKVVVGSLLSISMSTPPINPPPPIPIPVQLAFISSIACRCSLHQQPRYSPAGS